MVWLREMNVVRRGKGEEVGGRERWKDGYK